MKCDRSFTRPQIVAILNETERGVAVKHICRKNGIPDAISCIPTPGTHRSTISIVL